MSKLKLQKTNNPTNRNLVLLGRKNPSEGKPLQKFQAYIAEAKVCAVLLRELLVEIKEIIVVLALIGVFIYGVYELFHKQNENTLSNTQSEKMEKIKEAKIND